MDAWVDRWMDGWQGPRNGSFNKSILSFEIYDVTHGTDSQGTVLAPPPLWAPIYGNKANEKSGCASFIIYWFLMLLIISSSLLHWNRHFVSNQLYCFFTQKELRLLPHSLQMPEPVLLLCLCRPQQLFTFFTLVVQKLGSWLNASAAGKKKADLSLFFFFFLYQQKCARLGNSWFQVKLKHVEVGQKLKLILQFINISNNHTVCNICLIYYLISYFPILSASSKMTWEERIFSSCLSHTGFNHHCLNHTRTHQK